MAALNMPHMYMLGCCRVVVAQWPERLQLTFEALDSISIPMHFFSRLFLATSSYHQLLLISIQNTVIWFYFVLYLISYAAVRTKIKRTNIFQQ